MNFPMGVEFAAEAWQLHELTNCTTGALAKDELIVQIADGTRSDHVRQRSSDFLQTYKALLCTAGFTTGDALTRICTVKSETNTNGSTRAVIVLVAIRSSPSPRT